MTILWKWLMVNAIVAAVAFSGGYFWCGVTCSKTQADETTVLYLPVVSSDPFTPGVGEVFYYLPILSQLTVREQIQSLADQLSHRMFGDAPIDLMSIEERNGRSVATINLRDTEPIGRRSWRGLYFQGSSGGQGTSTTLIGTFLQRDYNGEWIDGVQFLYEGNPLDNFDHVPGLYDVTWRDSL